MSDGKRLETLTSALLDSHWPKCYQLAEEIVANYDKKDARAALKKALSAKRHHIGTAAIKALVMIDDESVLSEIEQLLNDPAYETRTEAQKAIELLRKR